MKKVRVLLKTGETVSFPNAAAQEKQDGRIAVYNESYEIVVEFPTSEIQNWWYDDDAKTAREGGK